MHNVMLGGQQVFKERSFLLNTENRKAKAQVRPKNVKNGQKSL